MSTNIVGNEHLPVNNTTSTTTISNDGSIAHLNRMLNTLHDEHQAIRIPSNISTDTCNKKLHGMNHRSTSRTALTDGKIVEYSSENSIVYRYYIGESSSVLDEHFDKAFKQLNPINSTRPIPPRGQTNSNAIVLLENEYLIFSFCINM